MCLWVSGAGAKVGSCPPLFANLQSWLITASSFTPEDIRDSSLIVVVWETRLTVASMQLVFPILRNMVTIDNPDSSDLDNSSKISGDDMP